MTTALNMWTSPIQASTLILMFQMQGPHSYHVHPEFDHIFHCRTRPLRNVNTAIHNDDEMFLYVEKLRENDQKTALLEYFVGGLQMLNLVQDLATKKCGSLINVRSFLDFASGYGRFTRFLVKELPPERADRDAARPAADGAPRLA